ncbi:hypothetical protein JET76_23225 [Pseudomonas putida]|uniref:Uncharacterized protein n=1 Tax=Pseudomonas putida TaxID=303 RepID=A0A7W2L3Y0_PSEPU|nr:MULTISPECIES: hypothetical protein [Pseudomonas]MBA6118028.1 hypothetical protein [Pseudomonas putida]MBI6944242.1 hypothetical protein [Pseudomonas putida]MBI6959332.1 hypothetical protein [Pseudomonas putida]MCZ9637674.1 hypothetical protein [Pseudomonas putida]QNL88178.1 Uncharacterized protein PPKH_2764 [Pseudomonas putida]
MTLFCRLSLLILIAGTLLGNIVIASIGLVGLCGAAVYIDIRKDAAVPTPREPEFLA